MSIYAVAASDVTASSCAGYSSDSASYWLRRVPNDGARRDQGPDLQNILRQSYDHLTIMPKLRSTYDGRLIYKTSYEGRKSFLRYDSLA